jgi:hypothetical protein
MEVANALYIRENDYETQAIRIWIFQRVMCVAYVGVCSWIIFNPIDAIKKSPPLFTNYNTSYGQEFASCDDLLDAIQTLPSLLLLVFCCLDKIVIMAPRRVIIRDFFLGPFFLFSLRIFVGATMSVIYTANNC